MKVAVGSTNPVKVAAARSVIERVWPGATIASVAVPSGVRAMPLSDAECQEGARNRALAAQQMAQSDMGMGIEGGVHEAEGELWLTAWTVIVDGRGRVGIGSSGRLLLPTNIANRVRSGEELGFVMDEVLEEANVKQKGGAVGALTAGLVLRQEALALGVTYALAPFISPQLYTDNRGNHGQ
ncbi:MAG: inosine/xanthosine triphosphatase [Chloroflexi bacterium]|nr:inosine/xanthosine triphosphatase [Chloroflexota bacterium]